MKIIKLNDDKLRKQIQYNQVLCIIYMFFIIISLICLISFNDINSKLLSLFALLFSIIFVINFKNQEMFDKIRLEIRELKK